LNPLDQDRLRLVRWPWILALLLLLGLGLLLARLGGWEAQAKEWLGLGVRFFHVLYAIAWIGASFYFIFLENSLERQGVREELSGNLWAIHGGGMYYLEKYKTAPKPLPRYLHWFKWDAYFTWITGFLLLVIVYYADPKTTLLSPESPLSAPMAVALGVLSLVLAWGVYVGLSRTVLLQNPGWFLLVGAVLVGLVAWGLGHVFSGRGTFIHVGAMLGTIMAGNVFFVIIPSQKALIRAAQSGQTLDPGFVSWVQLRSRHNNYLTLPVLFTMISNHFPSTYANGLGWLILLLLFGAGVAVRHFINVTEKEHHTTTQTGGAMPYLLVLAGALMLAAFYLSVPKNAPVAAQPVAFAQVQAVVYERCASCHAARPTQAGFASAPAGVLLDSPERIMQFKDQIIQVAVNTQYMPLGNITGMKPEERALLGAWYRAGAKGP